MDWLDKVNWDANGLVPVIAQEVGSNDVLMFAHMNREALALTVENTPGSLHTVLGVFARHGLNLIRLESRPH